MREVAVPQKTVGGVRLSACEAGTQRCRTVGDPDWWDGSPAFAQALAAHAGRQASMVSAASGLKAEHRKFVVYAATNDGMGNKLLPMVSAFALALLLDRAFLVDWTGYDTFQRSVKWDRNPGAVSDFFVNPFGDAGEWLYERVLGRDGALAGILGGEVEETMLDMRTPDYSDAKLGTLCRDLRALYAGSRVVRVVGDQNFLPLLAANPHHTPLLRSWMRAGNMFGPLARHLLRPTAAILARVEEMRSLFGPYTVGLQLRRREGIGMRGNEVGVGWECARHLRELYAPGGRTDEVRFFVATDAPEARDEARSELGAGAVLAFDHRTDRNSLEGVQWAVAEFLLLASTDDIIAVRLLDAVVRARPPTHTHPTATTTTLADAALHVWVCEPRVRLPHAVQGAERAARAVRPLVGVGAAQPLLGPAVPREGAPARNCIHLLHARPPARLPDGGPAAVGMTRRLLLYVHSSVDHLYGVCYAVCYNV